MKKFFVVFLGAMALLAMSVTGAVAYEGGWQYDSNGQEFMVLGDNSDGTGLYLWGTTRYCGSPGDSYSRMHRVLDRQIYEINWWIADSCDDGYVRVCIQNRYRETACSTYIDAGWDWYDAH